MSIKHLFQSVKPHTSDGRVSKDHWNDEHIFVAGDEPDDDDIGEGEAHPYMSDVDGSIMIKIKFGGVIKTTTWIPFNLIKK